MVFGDVAAATDSRQVGELVGRAAGLQLDTVVALETPRDAAPRTPPPVPVEARLSRPRPSALIEPGMVAGSRVTAAHASPR